MPLILALALALALARPTLRTLRAGGWVRPNYRGREVPVPLGVLMVVAGLVALVALVPLQRLAGGRVLYPRTGLVVLYGLGVALLGLIDDAFGSPPPGAGRSAPRGWRDHGAALSRGELSTGAVKALGALGLALLTTSLLALSTGRWLLAAAVLALATGALNQLDLRPGRAAKAWVALGAGLTLGTGEIRVLWTLGLFVGPALVAGWLDLRERAMLGDTGASLLGGVAGLWIVLTLGAVGQLVALGALIALTVYGELRSISALIARVPLLRKLDSWGRP